MANNIKNVSELLLAIRDRGVSDIEPYLKVKHGPTIGDMFEGLTKEIAEKSIFEGMDLRVVSGKIKNTDGVFSDQIDCMIVIGEGDKLPYTNDKYIYDINNVIMVIEVKKKLNMAELSEGYDNLQSVIRTQENDYRPLKGNAIRDAFRSIAKKPLNDFDNLSDLDYQDQMLYHVLVVEELLPIRVIFGYSGFTTEASLRLKYIEYLNKHLSTKEHTQMGYGPESFPSLIVAGDNSLIKTNGMPYSLHLQGVEEYCWMASYRKNPIVLLLELLWTRLSYQYDLPSIVFGDEIYNESLAPLLTIKAADDYEGWHYTEISYSKKNLSAIDKMENAWQPTVLTVDEVLFINKLCDEEVVTVDDFVAFFGNAEQVKNIIDKLKWAHLIYVNNNRISLLTKECKCVIVPQYGYVAADDYDGRLMNWVMKKMVELKSKSEEN